MGEVGEVGEVGVGVKGCFAGFPSIPSVTFLNLQLSFPDTASVYTHPRPPRTTPLGPLGNEHLMSETLNFTGSPYLWS